MDGLNKEEDLANELKKLLSANNSQVDNLFQNAEMEREAQEKKLKERLAKR
jgi:hypothetical protein